MFIPVFLMRYAHAASVRRVHADPRTRQSLIAIMATRLTACLVAIKYQAFASIPSCLHLSFSSNENTVISRRFFVCTFSRFGCTICPHFCGSFSQRTAQVLKNSQSRQHFLLPSIGQVNIEHFIIFSSKAFLYRRKE